MEKYVLLAVAALGVWGLVKLITAPLKWGLRLAAQGLCGFACLWLLNISAPVTGVLLPVNGVTVLLSGLLGTPGIALVALLELL